MVNFIKNLIVSSFLVLTIIFMIIDPENIINGVKNAILLWATKVFPVLFPFYIFSTLAIKNGLAHIIGELLHPIIRKLFRTSSISGFVFIMSLISGNPSSAIIISQLYEEGSITKNEAQHLLSFCVFTNPLFCIGTIGFAYFQNVSIGYIVLIAHIFSNILIGIILRYNIKGQIYEKYSLKKSYKKMLIQKAKNKDNFSETITHILQNGINTMFLICGFMIFYNLIIVMINSSRINIISYQALNLIFTIIPVEYKIYNTFFIGIFEMVLGIDNVVRSSLSLRTTVTIITMLISFGGLSIHTQIHSILYKVKLKYYPFLVSRIAQMVFGGIIAYYIFPLIYNEKTIHTSNIGNIHEKERNILLITIILLFITVLFFLHKRKEKRCQ